MTFSIYRFDPAVDKKPRMQEYQLDIETIKGKMLLNALEAIKEKNHRNKDQTNKTAGDKAGQAHLENIEYSLVASFRHEKVPENDFEQHADQDNSQQILGFL